MVSTNVTSSGVMRHCDSVGEMLPSRNGGAEHGGYGGAGG